METTTTTNLNYNNAGTTSNFNMWSDPERIQVNEYSDRIEMIYKQTSRITYTIYPASPPQVQLFKIVFSCVDGKWNKSNPIYGKIIAAQEESYEFED